MNQHIKSQTEKMEQFNQDSKALEDDNKFIHDKLIALTTAIMGFTIVMLGDGKLTQINECVLKVSWLAFGLYLIFSISVLWSSLRHKAIIMTRSALISMDESQLQFERDGIKKSEKTVVLSIAKNKEFFLKGFYTKSKKERQNDPYFNATKTLFEKYKDELNVTKYLHNQNFESLSLKDRLMMFCICKGEWSYIFFGIGMIALLVSALL